MVTFEDSSAIENYVQAQSIAPMARKRVGTRTVYRCHNNFGDMFPKITDLGLAQRGDGPGAANASYTAQLLPSPGSPSRRWMVLQCRYMELRHHGKRVVSKRSVVHRVLTDCRCGNS